MERIQKAYNSVIRRLEDMNFLVEKQYRFAGEIPKQQGYGAVILYNPPDNDERKAENFEEFIQGIFSDAYKNIEVIVNKFDPNQTHRDKTKGNYRRIRFLIKKGTLNEQKNSLENALWTLVENLDEFQKSLNS
jgi:hypothetical protein